MAKYDETLVEEKTRSEEERRNRNATHDRGADSDNGESSSRVGRANEDRSPVSKRARETTPGRQPLRKRLNRRLNSKDKKYRVRDCTIPKKDSAAYAEQVVLDQYGIESYVIKNEVWEEPHIALARNGIDNGVKYSLRVKHTDGTEAIVNPYETTRDQTLEKRWSDCSVSCTVS